MNGYYYGCDTQSIVRMHINSKSLKFLKFFSFRPTHSHPESINKILRPGFDRKHLILASSSSSITYLSTTENQVSFTIMPPNTHKQPLQAPHSPQNTPEESENPPPQIFDYHPFSHNKLVVLTNQASVELYSYSPTTKTSKQTAQHVLEKKGDFALKLAVCPKSRMIGVLASKSIQVLKFSPVEGLARYFRFNISLTRPCCDFRFHDYLGESPVILMIQNDHRSSHAHLYSMSQDEGITIYHFEKDLGSRSFGLANFESGACVFHDFGLTELKMLYKNDGHILYF